MLAIDRVQLLIERAAEAGILLVRACDLVNEETQGANLGSSSAQQTANGTDAILDGKSVRNNNSH